MFPNYHHVPARSEASLRPDRRPVRPESEIRLRVKRTLARQAA
jgi:hypothetical protein